jgi:hypothetical protein
MGESHSSTPAEPPPTAAAAADPVDAAQRRARLNRIAGPGQLHAAVLALLLSPGRAREEAAWSRECEGTAGAHEIRLDVQALAPGERLPWIERLVGRIAQGPLAQRRSLLRAARRQMAADGRADVSDRLRWLAIRHALGDVRALAQPGAAECELDGLDTRTALNIGRWSAFVSRVVPAPEVDLDPDSGGPTSGERWWREVMQPWPDVGATRDMPDTDALVAALHEVQALPWMLRPILVRRWVDAAVRLSAAGQLGAAAADALRITATLLDCPLPPALAGCFVECDSR